MRHFLERHIYSIALFIIVLALIVATWYANQSQRDFSNAIVETLARHETTLMDLAIIADRNGADEAVASIISDCARRSEFDTLLTSLATLSRPQLLMLQNMYESCGAYYPTQKAIMVLRLEELYRYYSELRAVQSTLIANDAESEARVVAWGELVALEKTRSELLQEQNALQQSIINELIQGSRPGDAAVRSSIGEAQNIAELLSVYDTRIDNLRNGLGEGG